MSDDSKPDGKGATALDAFDTLDLTPKKLITQLRFSESGDLLRVTFTREDGSSGDFQFNSSEIVKMVSGDTSKVADMLASDYPDIFSREFATRLLDGVSASSEFQAHAATLQQAVQEPLQNTGLGTQDAKPGTQDAEPSLGGTQSFANLVNMVAPPGAAHLSGDSGIPDPSRLVDLSAVPRGSGADESSAFLVQPDGTSTPPRVVPPPVPPISSEKRGKPGETVVLPDAREDDETVVLEGDDIKMESEPVAPVAAVGEHLGPVQTRGDISLVSDVPEPLQFAGETQPSVVVPEMESPTQVIRTAPEPLHPEGRGDRDEDVTQEIPADQKPKPVTPALVFPPSEGSESAQIDSSAQASVGEPTTQAASVQPAPQDAPQSSDATPQDAKPIPVVSIGRSGHVLVLLNDKSEVILGGRSILRVLNANKSGGRDEAARILSAEYPGIQSDLAGLILDKVCATDFVSNAIDFLSSSRQSASDQASSAHTKPIPPVSLSIRYNLLVIGHDSLEIVLDRAVVTRILLANKRGGRSEAERVLEHRPMGITSDDDKIILDQLCSPGFASTFRQLLSSQNQPASVQPSTPTQPPAQPSVSAPAQPAVSTPQPSPPVPTKDELNAMYLAAAGNGEVDEIKRAIALGADKEAKDSEKKPR